MLKKYKLSLFFISIFFFLGVFFLYGYSQFEKIPKESEHAIVFVNGSLSFNFMDGNLIKTKETTKTYHFSITNTSNEAYYYSLRMSNVHAKEATYEVKSSRLGFKDIKKTFPTEDFTFTNMVKISGKETHSYDFIVTNESNETVEAKLEAVVENEMNNFSNVLLKSNVINEFPKTKVGEEVALENEGLIESTDDYGTSYYFRGNVNNNYVSFGNFLWRIVKINGDGTVRLVLNTSMNEKERFFETSGDDFKFESSLFDTHLKKWFQTNLSSYDNYIANSKFCMDDSVGKEVNNGFQFTSLERLYTNHDPIYQCIGSSYVAKIGLLTADELSFAGANNKLNNKNFYLFNEEIKAAWWTISPATFKNNTYSFIEINEFGKMNEGTDGTLYRGIRPVINLMKKTIVTGSGTVSDPYLVNTL